MIYLELFLAFLQVGLFSFGGGMASLPLIQEQVVTNHGWLDLRTFTDLITIAEMTPGPIAINSATFVGAQVGGILGSVIATIGVVTAPTAIVSILAFLYLKYKNLELMQGILSSLRPAIVALIASAGLAILIVALWGVEGFRADLSAVNWVAVAIFGVALLILRKWKVNPISVMIGAGIVGGVVYAFI